MKLRFEIELLSDYHVSAGHGSGTTIDSALFRDSDGIPVLRGTTIAGLLREGMRNVLKSIDLDGRCHDGRGDSTETMGRRFCEPGNLCPVCRIMGCPSQAKQWQVSSARPFGEQLHRSESVQPGVAATVVQRSSTDVRKRRTIPARLFNRETGTTRLRFRFDVTGPNHAKADAALIVAAARMVRRLGQARRRGSGECIIRLVDDAGNVDLDGSYLQERLKEFQEHWLDTPRTRTSRSGEKQRSQAWVASQANATTPLRYQLILLTREPVLAAAARQSGNEIAGFGYIPGSAVLGAFAAQAASRWDLSQTHGTIYKAFVNVFRHGDVVFPTLYPALRSGAELHMGIPAPADLLECRYEPVFKANGVKRAGHHACLSKQDIFLVTCPECYAKAAQPDRPLSTQSNPLDRIEGFIDLHSIRRFEPRMREEMHVQLNPETQTAAEGQLFSYLAIDAGQYYYGELQFKSQRALDDFQQLIGAELASATPFQTSLRIGRAGGRGYGLVDVEVTEFPLTNSKGESVPSRLILDPIETRVSSASNMDAQRITLTFLTDTILTDAWGRYLHTVDERWLEEVCFDGHDVLVSLRGQFSDWAVTGGFYSHIGLPRQREIAIAAGSSCGFDLSLPNDNQAEWSKAIARMAELERDGVGLRRHEGLGRIAFNHPVYELQGIGSGKCAIPNSLRLSTNQRNAGEIQSLMQFISLWAARLTNEVSASRFGNAPWSGIGHWLMSLAPTALEEAIQALEGLTTRATNKAQGRDSARPGDPNYMFRFSANPFRETNFFADPEKGLDSLRHLIKLLGHLVDQASNRDDQQEVRGAGLRMLGAALVEAAKSKEKTGAR